MSNEIRKPGTRSDIFIKAIKHLYGFDILLYGEANISHNKFHVTRISHRPVSFIILKCQIT